MRAIIDADWHIYAAGFKAEEEPESHACQTLKQMLNKAINTLGVEDYSVYIGGGGNFREDVAVTQGYKENRKDLRKPKHFAVLREYLTEVWNAEVVNGMETDDFVSIQLYEDFLEHEGDPEQCTIILVSVDKDLNNTPGWHYNPQKDRKYFVTEDTAMKHFWYQMLMGDRTDNIPGLPDVTPWIRHKYGLTARKGFGQASARKVMATCTTAVEAEHAAVDCYIAYGIESGWTSDEVYNYLQEQGKLLWMVRELQWDEPVLFDYDRSTFDERFEQHPLWEYQKSYDSP